MEGLIAIPSNGSGGLGASVSTHFGRCGCFTLVDIGDGATAATILALPAHEDGNCAKRVRLLAERGVQGVVISSIGGHALLELQQAGIAVWRDQSQRPVAALVEAMKRDHIPRLGPGVAHDASPAPSFFRRESKAAAPEARQPIFSRLCEEG